MSQSDSITRERRPGRRAWMSTVAGILDICAGASSLVGAAVLAFLAAASQSVPVAVNEPVPDWPFAMGFALFFGLAMLLTILGVPAVIGGVYALRQARGFWPIIGAIAATLSCLPFGVPAIVLTVMYEHDLPVGKPDAGAGGC